MSRYLWFLFLIGLNLAGWGAALWLVEHTQPTQSAARLAFVAAVTLGIFAFVSLVAHFASALLNKHLDHQQHRATGQRQGLLWAGLLATIVLLRFSGELSALTMFIVLAFFIYFQFVRLGESA
jgi:hypothetical protein